MRRIRKVYLQNAAGDRWGLNGENGVYVSSLAGFGYTLSPTYADLTRGFFLAVSGESEPQGTVPFTVYFTRNAYAVYQSFVDWPLLEQSSSATIPRATRNTGGMWTSISFRRAS